MRIILEHNKENHPSEKQFEMLTLDLYFEQVFDLSFVFWKKIFWWASIGSCDSYVSPD